tara:strand:- start:2 stop:454 length:453 start_codon:yes stop_codon:yes gene_type:complete
VKIYDGLSEETVAFNASIYVDGKKVGDAKNNGRGGANDIDVFTKDGRWNRDLISEMEDEAATHTWTYEGETYSHTLDSYIGKLVDDFDEQRSLKKLCRTKIVVSAEGEQNFGVFDAKWPKDIGGQLQLMSKLTKQLHPKVITEFINKRFE